MPVTAVQGNRIRRRQRGGALASALIFVLIISILLMGVGNVAASHQQRADMDLYYAQAYDLAVAGVNYELRAISVTASNASQSPGATYSLGPGTFTVYVTDRSNGTWSSGESLYVYSTGTVNGVSRTLKIAAKMIGGDPYVMYALHDAKTETPMSITGDVGTNVPMTFHNAISATNPLDGHIDLNGPSATLTGTGYSVSVNSQALSFPTTDEIALELFPEGGVPWLKTHNDNSRAVPPIVNNSLTNDAVTLVGPGDYYLETFDESDTTNVTWDDRLGPIRIWIGPDQGGGKHVHLGHGIRYSNTPQTTVYLASDSYVHVKMDMVFVGAIYAYNLKGTTALGQFGMEPMSSSDAPSFSGQVVAASITNNTGGKPGNPSMTYIPGLISQGGSVYYGFDNTNLSSEVNPR